ncbi:alpha/beta-hydrolase [Mycena vitilis]|nr:alpha/beta-hydrolase [Mycena vitilis]
MRLVSLYISVFITFSGARQLTSNLGPVVDLGYAAYAGNTTSPAGLENGPVAFYGNIRYAEPPLGERRFRAPVQFDEGTITSQVLDARNWGPPCIQIPAVVGIGSEDCLTLNVWKPTNASVGEKLPVAVYIHGGAFFELSPQGFPMYDWVAQHTGGIVGVSLAYRLTMLGFLGGSVVEADGDLNTGLLDQRAALEWVQRHISEFGGDPDNVSIYGESAGGASVVMQVTAYGGSKPAPFKRATAQSVGYGPTNTAEQTEGFFKTAAQYIGCPASGRDAMPCLRNASIGAISSALNRIGGIPFLAFTPVIEGPDGFMPDLPSRLIAAGKMANVEFVGGHTTGDGSTFTFGLPDQFQSDDDIRRIVFPRWSRLTNATFDKAFALYPQPGTPGSPFATQWDRASAMSGDVIFTCMDWFLADKLTKNNVTNVFLYSWDAPDPAIYAQTPYLGAAHTSDLYYLFEGTNQFGNAGNTFTPFNTSEAVLAKEAIAYWTSFGATGNPSEDKDINSPIWEPFVQSNSSRRRLMLARGDNTTRKSAMENITEAQIKRCEFWMSEDVVAETGV